MKKLFLLVAVVSILASSSANASDYRLEILNEAAPADAISKEIAATLSPKGLRIIRGQSRKICDIWLCKHWETLAENSESDEIIYPFKPGQLIGVIRYNSKGSDFRDQEIGKGVYTLRYAHQPVDGDHVGTSPTRDFLLLLKAKTDKSKAILDYDTLVEESSEAAETTHPAQLLLHKIEAKAKIPSIRHFDENEWWSVRFKGQAKRDEKLKPIRVELIVVGHAIE